MAPPPVVPADFGIDNLYSELHGNIIVKLENNAQMTANSMILSLNSPVLRDIFRNLEIRTIDMDDFSGFAVKVFLEAFYTGEVLLNKQLFRDINKMANVFKVAWLVSRCESYFDYLVQTADHGFDYESIRFVFDEAIFLKNSVKKPEYFDVVLKNLTGTANIETVFIERYMADYVDFSTNELDLMIHIAGENVHIFMKIVKQNMTTHGLNFDDNTKYLLQHVDLVKCMEHDMELYEEVFDMLFEKAENVSIEDMRILVKLHREAVKENRLKEQSKVPVETASVETASAETAAVETAAVETESVETESVETALVPVRNIPNMFHCPRNLSSTPDYAFVDAILASPDVKNLYMLFELLDCGDKWGLLPEDALQKVIEGKQARGWCAVEPDFLGSLYWLTLCHAGTFAWINGCAGLVSTIDSVRIVCNQYTNARALVLEENMYKFYFQHGQIASCSNPTQCGFILKVFPLTSENPLESFDIQLVTDPASYPPDIHYHHNSVISVQNMHLVVEGYHEHYRRWYNWCVSWRGRPRDKNEEVYWGGWYFGESRKVRLIVMYHNPTT